MENKNEKIARYFSSHAPILLQQAIDILHKRLLRDPKNGSLWLQLGNYYRGLGELEFACDAFSRAEKLSYKPTLCSYLTALCNQNPTKLVYPDTPFTPSPFLRTFNFLSDEELKMVWQVFSENTQNFKISRTDGEQVIKTKRNSTILVGHGFKRLTNLFKRNLKPVLAQALETFSIERPEKQRYGVQMTSHSDGEFYRTHTDSGPKNARVLSYVYYFHKSPKAFAGGELQLFDTDTTLNTAAPTMTSIEPMHNSLIVFPSNYYHQVCTVIMPNTDRLRGRQTINGWLVDAQSQDKMDSLYRNK